MIGFRRKQQDAPVLDPPDQFGKKARFIARQDGDWFVAADSLRVLLLRLRGTPYEAIYERQGKQMAHVPRTRIEPVVRELSEKYKEVH